MIPGADLTCSRGIRAYQAEWNGFFQDFLVYCRDLPERRPRPGSLTQAAREASDNARRDVQRELGRMQTDFRETNSRIAAQAGGAISTMQEKVEERVVRPFRELGQRFQELGMSYAGLLPRLQDCGNDSNLRETNRRMLASIRTFYDLRFREIADALKADHAMLQSERQLAGLGAEGLSGMAQAPAAPSSAPVPVDNSRTGVNDIGKDAALIAKAEGGPENALVRVMQARNFDGSGGQYSLSNRLYLESILKRPLSDDDLKYLDRYYFAQNLTESHGVLGAGAAAVSTLPYEGMKWVCQSVLGGYDLVGSVARPAGFSTSCTGTPAQWGAVSNTFRGIGAGIQRIPAQAPPAR